MGLSPGLLLAVSPGQTYWGGVVQLQGHTGSHKESLRGFKIIQHFHVSSGVLRLVGGARRTVENRDLSFLHPTEVPIDEGRNGRPWTRWTSSFDLKVGSQDPPDGRTTRSSSGSETGTGFSPVVLLDPGDSRLRAYVLLVGVD